ELAPGVGRFYERGEEGGGGSDPEDALDDICGYAPGGAQAVAEQQPFVGEVAEYHDALGGKPSEHGGEHWALLAELEQQGSGYQGHYRLDDKGAGEILHITRHEVCQAGA